MRKKCLIVFGTRPEAIKMAPIIQALREEVHIIETKVCVTAQHREMLDQVLEFFDIKVDYDLNIMRPDQNLYTLTSNLILQLQEPLEEYKPDYVFVHGDTTTSMAASVASFYSGAKVCHIEAGLRTNNKLSPFPEEVNRQITSRIANYHFAPTVVSREHLLKENISKKNIVVTGNSVIDALLIARDKLQEYTNTEIEDLKSIVNEKERLILVTGHRRENHGQGFINICQALRRIAEQHPHLTIIYPVHLNPNVLEPVRTLLKDVKNIKLVNPLSYPAFVWLMNKSYFVLTDSGGVQEEAPSLGKPVLVMRDTTERPEAVDAGTVVLVGTDIDKIIHFSNKLLLDDDYYKKMASVQNPYGDGLTSSRVVDFLKSVIK